MSETSSTETGCGSDCSVTLAGYWHDKHEMCFILWAFDWFVVIQIRLGLGYQYLGFLEDRPLLTDQ
ncbi:uncharacterized protein N7496_012190 [Penicillium cataractarum]|uniref:Uncharacterized protein n=1 Tax=Penicillium cataractarum TaxID=2100454 RepID=A0A9W9R7E3_9EURO|nr:uncharacterized protein N7496_012190 [Penicillium cataractarum]KAJ5354978.1 hypothetical protein N7496_012190 [Penicillium cataractarum]